MVADAIVRYRLEDDSKDPDLVQAIKYSAGTLYAGDHHSHLLYCLVLTIYQQPSKQSVLSVVSFRIAD